jgi:hypothetical protein
MSSSPGQVRLNLREREARALYAGLEEAIAADLIGPGHVVAARAVLARLATKVPGWLDRAPVSGEAGHLIGVEAILRALVAGEEGGRSALSESELAHALADRKPVGVTITDVLSRMSRERLLRTKPPHDDATRWWSAAPAGRRMLTARSGAASSEEWRVHDADALAELIFREHRPDRFAHRAAVQAIGQLTDGEFERLATELQVAGLLEPVGEDLHQLELSTRGSAFAEDRVRLALPRHTLVWELPPPPLPYRRGLPLRVEANERHCRCGSGHAAWLAPRSTTKLHRVLRRDGAADWDCRWCGRRWLIFLLACRADGQPAYDDPHQGVFVRPIWRPR